MRLKTQKGYISRENIICSRKNPCRMYFSGQMSVYRLMKECEHWRAFDHKIYFAGYDYIGNRKKYYWLCRRASNCPFPNAQGCSSGRKQSVWPLLALSSFILQNAGSASRLLSKSFTAVSTLLVRVTWLWSNHDGRIMHGRIMFQKPGSIHCTEIGCKMISSLFAVILLQTTYLIFERILNSFGKSFTAMTVFHQVISERMKHKASHGL